MRDGRADDGRRQAFPPWASSVETRVWYNPDMLSRNFIVPGLIAVIMMIITGNLSSLTIAREWENGTMEQLLSTPVRPAEMALGKLSAYFVVGLVDMVICLFVGVYRFRRSLEGQPDAAAGDSSCVFLFGSLCVGHFDFGLDAHQLIGLSDRHADIVSSRFFALRIHLFDQQHAAL